MRSESNSSSSGSSSTPHPRACLFDPTLVHCVCSLQFPLFVPLLSFSQTPPSLSRYTQRSLLLSALAASPLLSTVLQAFYSPPSALSALSVSRWPPHRLPLVVFVCLRPPLLPACLSLSPGVSVAGSVRLIICVSLSLSLSFYVSVSLSLNACLCPPLCLVYLPRCSLCFLLHL